MPLLSKLTQNKIKKQTKGQLKKGAPDIQLIAARKSRQKNWRDSKTSLQIKPPKPNYDSQTDLGRGYVSLLARAKIL